MGSETKLLLFPAPALWLSVQKKKGERGQKGDLRSPSADL